MTFLEEYARVIREHNEMLSATTPEIRAEVEAYSARVFRDRGRRSPSPSVFTNVISNEDLIRYSALVRGKSDYFEAVRTALQYDFDGSDGHAQFNGTKENGSQLTEDDFEREPFLQDGLGVDHMYDPYVELRPGSPLVDAPPSNDAPIRSADSHSRLTWDKAPAAVASAKSTEAKKRATGDRATSTRGGTPRASLAQTSRTGLRNSRTSQRSSSTRTQSPTDKPSSSSCLSAVLQHALPVFDQCERQYPAPSTHASLVSSHGSGTSLPSSSGSTPGLTDGPSSSSRSSSLTLHVSEKLRHLDVSFSDAAHPVSLPLQTPAAAKQYLCEWRKMFGGTCDQSFEMVQGHDRHIITHLPDEDGNEICNFKCTLCGDEFPRDDSCKRHIRTKHARHDPNSYCEELSRHWWWPRELFLSRKYNNPEHVLPAPPDIQSSWSQRFGAIINKYPEVLNKPRRSRLKGNKGDDSGQKTRRSVKRQRIA